MTEILAAHAKYRRRIVAAGENARMGAASKETASGSGKVSAETGKLDWILGVSGRCRQSKWARGVRFFRAQTKFFDTPKEAD